jgi:multiple sugar transport system substrate-binding protein
MSRTGPGTLTRRDFLKGGGVAAAGMAGILAAGRPPAFAQQRELTILTWSHFVPVSDKELKRQCDEFAKLNNIKVRLDTIAHLQLATKRAAEAQSRSGHDMIMMYAADPDLYFEHLVDVTDVASEVGPKLGGWVNEEDWKLRGQFKAIPWYHSSHPLNYRSDLLERIAERPPDTWDELLRVGKKLKAIGHPVGIQLSHSNDSNHTMRVIMFSHGASYVAKDGKTITLNSPETAQAIEYVKRLYTECMEPEVLSWDDASNNRSLVGGKAGIILNPTSAYESARASKAKIPGTQREIHEVIEFTLPPRGPAGRFAGGSFFLLSIWNFSKNIDLAKEFLRWHFSPEQQDKYIAGSLGFNHPLSKKFLAHPVWAGNPKFKTFAAEISPITRHMGYPGPATGLAQLVFDLHIIPDMFAQAATGRLSTPAAIEWAEKEIKEVYAGRRQLKKG